MHYRLIILIVHIPLLWVHFPPPTIINLSISVLVHWIIILRFYSLLWMERFSWSMFRSSKSLAFLGWVHWERLATGGASFHGASFHSWTWETGKSIAVCSSLQSSWTPLPSPWPPWFSLPTPWSLWPPLPAPCQSPWSYRLTPWSLCLPLPAPWSPCSPAATTTRAISTGTALRAALAAIRISLVAL